MDSEEASHRGSVLFPERLKEVLLVDSYRERRDAYCFWEMQGGQWESVICDRQKKDCNFISVAPILLSNSLMEC